MFLQFHLLHWEVGPHTPSYCIQVHRKSVRGQYLTALLLSVTPWWTIVHVLIQMLIFTRETSNLIHDATSFLVLISREVGPSHSSTLLLLPFASSSVVRQRHYCCCCPDAPCVPLGVTRDDGQISTIVADEDIESNRNLFSPKHVPIELFILAHLQWPVILWVVDSSTSLGLVFASSLLTMKFW